MRRWRCVTTVALALACASSALSAAPDARDDAGLTDDLRWLADGDAFDASGVQALARQALADATNASTRTAALVRLGDAFFYGDAALGAWRVNGSLALRLFARAADAGNAHAQFHVGVAQSYGLWGVPRDEPAALLSYYFAALGENTAAALALGHRHLLGVGAPRNCETAVRYYEVAANRAVQLREANASQPAVYDLPHRRLKTVAETQHKKNTPSDAAIVDYYQFSADKGDPEATLNLATLYYYGARGLAQDLPRAAALFHRAHELGASGGAFHLGHIYNHGIGVAANNATALEFLQAAASEGNTQAVNELAVMHLHGRGTPRDVRQATTLFQSAAKQGNMEAFYNLGVLHMQGVPSAGRDPEYEVAHGYFQVAAHQGHTVASHKLGHMSLHGIGTARSCKSAADAFKLVAERGPWDKLLTAAFKDFKAQDYDAAFLKYAVLAQQGYELAQHNAAYLLDYGYLTPLFAPEAPATAAVAMMLYKLAALQGNVDANLKIGDFYYYGKGGHAVDFARASAHYSLASKRANAQAMFNLGYMYEHGVGVDQDFYLAKRFLDKAREAHSDAHVPVTLALWKLKVHTFVVSWKRVWDIFVGTIEAPPPAPQPPASSPSTSTSSSAAAEADAAAQAKSYVESLLAAWWPSIVTGADSTTAASGGAGAGAAASRSVESALSSWRDMVTQALESDDLLIVLLMLALGVVLYIRSERHILGDPMPPPQQPQPQQPQQ
ncbi:hypothetical protein PybrP1_000638 [[Pythium] brassicae (nom. inval.)]|nr:hypothetical protein PybrP1_000638 [[Pythium] brassicae (nom. inval.)]